MSSSLSLFVTCPKGLEILLLDELQALEASACKQTVGGVYCQATLLVMYKICLWSRLANRVLLLLTSGPVASTKDCYQLSYEYDWSALFNRGSTLAVRFSGQTNYIRNTMYGAQLVKDAIVDNLVKAWEERCDIDPHEPDCAIRARLHHGELSLFYDLSGHSLHQRGYRKQAGAAPLKENLAAALLMRAQWPELMKTHPALIDPCCGSATLLIEAAMMATEKAPGLDRFDFGFLHWQGHDPKLWQSLQTEAYAKHERALEAKIPLFYGYDKDDKVLQHAAKNIHAAGFVGLITLERKAVSDFVMPGDCVGIDGLIITNPPYGERLEEAQDLVPLYQELGLALSQQAKNWHAAVFTNDAILAKAIGLRSHKKYAFFNGAIACALYLFTMDEDNRSSVNTLPERATMIMNRLKKNKRTLKAWIKQNNIEAYRIYDADIPEYACAIDIYQDWAVVQEYKAPSEISVEKARQRVRDVINAIPFALDVPPHHIVLKQRLKQKGKQQYKRQADTSHELVVTEGSAKIIVNCKDYLDTGLFLDHRLIRRQLFETARGKEMLNLFCYTGVVSLQAALGGAKTTVNVDMSRTYLDWAKENFRLNKLNLRNHQFIQADCLKWIFDCKQKFDIIFLDPPSFSNSKRMDDTLDIQRDHVKLIHQCMRLLKPTGVLYFSTNNRKFKLDSAISEKFSVENITPKTIDKDFARRSNIHHCFLIRL